MGPRMISKRAIRVTTIKKRDAKRALLRLGFREEDGGDHTKYIHDNPFAIVILGRGSKLDFLRARESDNLRNALGLLGREDLYRSMIGLPARKKERKVVVEVPFFSSWANGVAKVMKGLTFDRYTDNVEEALHSIFLSPALENDPTLTPEGFKEDLGHLIDLISNDENHYISKLGTADVLLAIRLVDSFDNGEASAISILSMLGESPALTEDVERHIEMLRKKGFVLRGGAITLSEKGIEASASSASVDRLLKLSIWVAHRGLRKEAAAILRLAHNDSWIPGVFTSEFRNWLRRRMIDSGDARVDARSTVKKQMIDIAIILRDNPYAIRSYYMMWSNIKDDEARYNKLSLDKAKEEYLRVTTEGSKGSVAFRPKAEQLKLF